MRATRSIRRGQCGGPPEDAAEAAGEAAEGPLDGGEEGAEQAGDGPAVWDPAAVHVADEDEAAVTATRV